jgi:hypothetical protein
MNSASLCSLAGRNENPIPPQCLAPIDFLKIPAQDRYTVKKHVMAGAWCSIGVDRKGTLLKSMTWQEPVAVFVDRRGTIFKSMT